MWRVLIKKGGERERIHALTYVKEGKKKNGLYMCRKTGFFSHGEESAPSPQRRGRKKREEHKEWKGRP